MRVLQVLPTLGYGGVARVVLNYRQQLAARGFTFDFVTHGGVEDFHEGLLRTGSRIFYVRPLHEVGVRGYLTSLRDLHPASYDVVHIHTGHVTGVYALFFRLLGQARLVLHAHSTVAVNARHRTAMPLLRLLALSMSRTRLACGAEAGDFCFGRGHYEIVPNGLDLEAVESVPEERITQLRNELSLPPEGLSIAHVGRFTQEKNQQFTVTVLERLCTLRGNVRLLFVGDGPLRGQVETLVSSKGLEEDVLFLGNRSDVVALMRCVDVIVLPSLFEGLPMTIVEAQACGTPSVVSDVVDHSVDLGLRLVDFVGLGSADEWAIAVVRAADSVDVHPRLDQTGAKIAEAGYDIAHVGDLVAGYYESVAGKTAI